MANQAPSLIRRLPRASPATLRSSTFTSSQITRRWGSTHSHDDHGHHEADTFEYKPEGFTSPFWRNVAIVTILSYGMYEIAPTRTSLDGQESWITKFLASITPDDKLWKERNSNHLALTKVSADEKWLHDSAQRPKVPRYRYTGLFEDASPHNLSVEEQAQSRDFVIKSNKLTKL